MSPNHHHHKHHHHLLTSKTCCLLILPLLTCCLKNNIPKLVSAQQSSHSNSPLMLTQTAPTYHQHNNILHFVVSEGAPNNTWIGNIKSADGQVPSYVFSTSTTPEHERLAALSVNFTTGDLITCGQLDRERREQYTFIAIVSEPFGEIKCTVTVRDVNDNAPLFLMPPNENNFVLEIPEGQRGLRRPLPIAIDFDSLQFGVQEFQLSGNTPTGLFKIVEHEAPASSINAAGDDSASSGILATDNPQLQQQLAQQSSVLIPSQPSAAATTSAALATIPLSPGNSPAPQRYLIDLEVSQALDRENQSSYQLVLEAVDKGQPPLYGRLMVTVNVQDVNDNDPIFTRKLYECSHREDAPKGTLLIKVQAHDMDLDANGQISYFLKRHSSFSQQQQLNNSSNLSDTNTIELSSSNNRYATSGGGNMANKRPAAAQISATPPSNNNNAKPTRQQGELYESTDQSTSSNQFKKISTGGHSGPVVVTTQDQQLFEIDPVKGEIYLAQQLDYETDQAHELLIEARDHGKPQRSAYAIVKVLVIDINDVDSPISLSSSQNRPDDRRQISQVPSSEASKADKFGPGDGSLSDQNTFLLIPPIVMNWFAQLNSSLLFIIVLVALFAVAFSVCLVKIKSRQPDASDYNDNTPQMGNLSNTIQTKLSPNHSAQINNEIQNGGSLDNHHHRHHDHSGRSINGSFGSHNGVGGGAFGSAGGKLSSNYHCSTSSNLYHNLPNLNQNPRHTWRHPGGAFDSAPPSTQPLDCWFDLGGGGGGPSQLTHDLFSSYDWDYLSDWAPDYHTLMPPVNS